MAYDYWKRDFVNERLRLKSTSQSYALVPATPSGRIRSDSIIFLLNQSRRGIDAPLTAMPSDLMTPEETAAHFAPSGITLGDLRRWTHRKRNVAPHFRINKRVTRFSAAMLESWLAENSAIPMAPSAPSQRRSA